MAKFAGGHRPELAGDLHVDAGGLLEARAFHEAHAGVDDGFGGKTVAGAGFEAEHVAGKMEGADLAAAVGEKLVAAHGPGDDLVDIFGRLVLAIDLLVLAVGEFGGDEANMARDRTELVGHLMGRGNLATDLGVDHLGLECLGQHLRHLRCDDALVRGIGRFENFERYLKGGALRRTP
ncbi:hypothetical protein ACVJA9_004078 [Bradyrhizobium diazoefficiens]